MGNLGRIIDNNTLTAVFAGLHSAHSEAPAIAVPVTAPQALDEMVARHGGRLIRTRTDIRALMAMAEDGEVQLACDACGGFICPEFHSCLDAMYALVKFVRLARMDGRSLAELVDSIPRFALAREDVHCPGR